MLGCMSSYGLVADTGDAHDLAIVIDRRRSSRAVAGDQRQVLDLVRWSQSPDGWTKLEDLRRYAHWVMNIIFRPSDCLTQVVGSCCKAVVAARKVGKSPHRALSIFPDEPEIDISDVVRRTCRKPRYSKLPQAAPDRRFARYRR